MYFFRYFYIENKQIFASSNLQSLALILLAAEPFEKNSFFEAGIKL